MLEGADPADFGDQPGAHFRLAQRLLCGVLIGEVESHAEIEPTARRVRAHRTTAQTPDAARSVGQSHGKFRNRKRRSSDLETRARLDQQRLDRRRIGARPLQPGAKRRQLAPGIAGDGYEFIVDKSNSSGFIVGEGRQWRIV